jgi:CheY-like chemotaxis protein
MDPGTLAVVGTTYVAALVARTAADDLAADLWARIKAALKNRLGREPEPKDVTAKALEGITPAPVVQQRLQALVGESPILRRAQVVQKAVRGARILWIDDRPKGNVSEHDCLTGLGAVVKTAETTRSAIALLVRERYDLILSDIAREHRDHAGIDDLPKLLALAPAVPIVLYVGQRKPGVPASVFGITDRPDELLHLCMDALERRRF